MPLIRLNASNALLCMIGVVSDRVTRIKPGVSRHNVLVVEARVMHGDVMTQNLCRLHHSLSSIIVDITH